MMTQLIINNTITLPYASMDKYAAWEEPLSVQLDMISGRRVVEQRGLVWRIRYQYDYMGNALMRQLLTALRGGGILNVQFLPDTGDTLLTSTFLRESLTEPTFAFGRDGVGYWHGIEFELREVSPHA